MEHDFHVRFQRGIAAFRSVDASWCDYEVIIYVTAVYYAWTAINDSEKSQARELVRSLLWFISRRFGMIC